MAVAVDLLVADRALDDQDEWVELTLLGVVPGPDEVVPGIECKQRVVNHHLRHAGDRPGDDVLQARAGGSRERHGLAVAAQASGRPQDVNAPTLPPCAGLGCHLSFLGFR